MRAACARRGLWLILGACAAISLLGSGCRQVQLPDGFACSASGACPSPYQCYGGGCYKQPPADGGGMGGSGVVTDGGTDGGGKDAAPDRHDGAGDVPPSDGGPGDAFPTLTCDGGGHVCSGACVDSQSIQHCGDLCVACPQAAGTTATCDGRTCDFSCTDSTQKKCGTGCVSGCCTDDDCPPQNGQAGKCDTSSNTCSYSCATSTKPCGTVCIDSAACCIDGDCPAQTGETVSCNLTSHQCGFTCATGYKACSDGSCVLTAGCCADTECQAMAGAGQSGTCTTHACVFTCTTGNKMCGQLCIATSSCCLDTDCVAQAGKVGLCDTSTHQCNYNCSTGQKPCGTSCIATSNCCANTDCTGTTGQVGACSAAGTCSFSCGTGYKMCGSGCILTSACCVDADCKGGTGQVGTCTVTTGVCQYSCGTGYKMCGNACIANAACCTNTDCPPPTGQTGTCNAGTGACQYTCAGGYKPCGTGVCILMASCCSSSDCVPPITGQIGSCNMSTGACSYMCGTGLKNCNNTSCIATASCCTNSDCVPTISGQVGTCNTNTGACSFVCGTGLKNCNNTSCIATASCCTNSDCVPTISGQVGTCNTLTGACSFACGSGLKNCNGACIANASCCSNTDCVPTISGQVGTCNTLTGACSFACGSGLKNCNNTSCIANASCCTNADCVPTITGQVGTCNTLTGACSFACGSGLKNCNGACIANASCCTSTDCPPGNMCTGGSCLANSGCPASPTTPGLGCPCSPNAALKCNPPVSPAVTSKLPLACQGGVWTAQPACDSTHNCDSTSGSCAPIISQCMGQSPGFAFCDYSPISPVPPYQDVRKTCGVDLVTTTSMPCSGICDATLGCQNPRCGDLKVEAPEQCDDGNTVALDGCEPASAAMGAACTKSQILAVSAGVGHTCARFNGGYARCWGANDVNQLGLGHTQFEGTNKPYQLTALDSSGNPIPAGPIDFGGLGVTSIVAGSDFSCAILTDQTLRCWGKNDQGQLGFGNTNSLIGTPNALGAVNLGGSAQAVALGGNFACALLTNGNVRCWGANTNGRLGAGTGAVLNTSTPAQIAAMFSGWVSLGQVATAIGAGGSSACARLNDGSVRCWGANGSGQLGTGMSTSFSLTMVPSAYSGVLLPAGKTATSISVGASFGCVRLSDATAECWGDNTDGQLGLGSTGEVGAFNSPAANGLVLTPVTGVDSIVTGLGLDTCAFFANGGGLHCWGDNSKGQLGYPDLNNRGDTPQDIPSIATAVPAISFGTGLSAVSFSMGSAHACAVLSDGELRCWGWNNDGQLGLGTTSAAPNDFVGGSASTTPNNSVTSVPVFPPPS